MWEEFARYFCFCFILRAEGKGKKNDIEMFHEPKTNLMKHKKKDFPPKWGVQILPNSTGAIPFKEKRKIVTSR